jgi:hypothetical protein
MSKEKFIWSPEKDLLTDKVKINGKEYPTWIVIEAIHLQDELGHHMPTTFENALITIERIVEKEKNATMTGPDDFNRAFLFHSH